MILFVPFWALLLWFPRFVYVAILAALLAYPAWFIQIAALYPNVEQPSLYLLGGFSANFALGGIIVVMIGKWLKSRRAKRRAAEQDALLSSVRDTSSTT